MAKAFKVPFLGRLPLDNKMTGACEEGVSFLEEYPDSVAAPAFSKIVEGTQCASGRNAPAIRDLRHVSMLRTDIIASVEK
jgi:hypothetical protein